MKDGRTHLAYKDEHAVDLDTGAILAVTVQAADTGDTKSMPVTLEQAQTNLVAIREESAKQTRTESGVEEVVGDKGYHSDDILQYCADKKIRSYISEPKRNRKWKGKPQQKKAAQANRRRIRGNRGKALLRRRGELVERPFAHRLDRGRLRRVNVRGQDNVYKQELLLSAAQNLGLLMRAVYGAGTPRCRSAGGAADQRGATGLLGTLLVLLSTRWGQLGRMWTTVATTRLAWRPGYAAQACTLAGWLAPRAASGAAIAACGLTASESVAQSCYRSRQ